MSVGELRVLAVLPAFVPHGGAEQSVLALAGPMRDRGVDLHVALFGPNDVERQVKNAGITIHDLSVIHGAVRRARSLRRLATDLDVSVVHATLFDATVPAQMMATVSRVPLLITWALTPGLDASSGEGAGAAWKRQAVRVLDMALARSSGARFHAVTTGVATTMRRSLRVPASRVLIGERGRDPADFVGGDRALTRRTIGLTDECRLVLAIGRQDRQKAYVGLLDAFEEVATADPHARLAIAGRSGSDSAAIEARLGTLRCADRVFMLGHRGDVRDLLAAADLVVCASWREGAAGAVVEAMAGERPVLSVELDGLEGILEDGVNARVVQREFLARAMGELLGDADVRHRLAVGGRETFERRFTIDRAADRMVEIYRSVALGIA